MNNKKLFLFALIAISLGINVYFRLNSLFLRPIEKVAQKNVHSVITDKLQREIDKVYPNLIPTDKEVLLGQVFKLYLKEHKLEVKNLISQKNRELKNYWQDDNGWPYLLEIDGYRWYRRVENYLNTGNFGTSRIQNEDRDDLMLAPFGAKVEPIKFHFYIAAYFYKFLHLIDHKLALKEALAFLPVFLSIFMVIGIFCLARFNGISYLGSFVSSLVTCLSLPLLMRSSFAWFDTDAYNIFLPIFITLSVAYSFRVNVLWKKILFLFLAGLLIGIFSAIWSIWWFIFYIIIVGLVLYKLNILISNECLDRKSKFKDSLFSLSLFIFFSYLCVWLISGLEIIKDSLSLPFLLFSLKQNVAIGNFWPAMSSLIAELMKTDISSVVSYLGGNIIFCGGLIGFLIMMITKKEVPNFKENNFLLFVLFTWLVVMLFLSLMARRFVLFLAVPVGIFFGAFLDALGEIIKKIKLPRFMGMNISGILLSSIFIFGAILPIHNVSGFTVFPYFNDTWKNMMMKINNSTPKDAIINTYWTSGDFIMTIAKRSTIHCAQYNQIPVSYWVARALLTEDEKEAIGILRMLDAGSTHAFDEISKLLNNDKLLAMDLISKMFLVDQVRGRILLIQHTSDTDIIKKILKLMYEPQHPAYFLVDGQLIARLPNDLISLANWDFKMVNLWQQFRYSKKEEFIAYAKNKFGYTLENAQGLYNTFRLTDKKNMFSLFSHGVSYKVYTDYLEKSVFGKNEKMIIFDNGLLFDKQDRTVFFRDDLLGKWIIPAEIIFVTQNGLNENYNKNGDSGYSCIILEEGNTYKAVLLSKEVAHSVLARLYFMKGSGLKHFNLVEQEENKEKNEHLYLYKINWND